MFNETSTELTLFFCVLVNFPEGSHRDCSYQSPEKCYICPYIGGYLSQHGQLVSILIWILIIIIGTLGSMANVLIVAIFTQRKKRTGFDFLLICLASFDLVSCFAVIISATGTVAYLSKFYKIHETFSQKIILVLIKFLHRQWTTSLDSFYSFCITDHYYSGYLVEAAPLGLLFSSQSRDILQSPTQSNSESGLI